MAPTEIRKLEVGDFIYADVIINLADMADPNSKSTTATKVKQGKAVPRIAVVLAKGEGFVHVTYSTTFKGVTTLPAIFADKTMWYPRKPAKKESIYEPLPATLDGVAGWYSLRRTQRVDTPIVEKLVESVSPATAGLIRGAMKA